MENMHHLHILIRQFLSQIWKHTDRPFQDALHIGNGDTVVSDWHVLINSTFHPIADLALIQHTASAMNNQCIFRQIFRKFSAGTQLNIQLFACVILQPSRYLNTADVITLAMMGAALCDQHCISVFQIFHCGNPTNSRIQKSLMSGHQNRKRCQRNTFRYIRRYLCKNLAIRDNTGRRFLLILPSAR